MSNKNDHDSALDKDQSSDLEKAEPLNESSLSLVQRPFEVSTFLQTSSEQKASGDFFTGPVPSGAKLSLDNAYCAQITRAFIDAILSKSHLEICGDDKLFQNALRAYGAAYFFLGGVVFAKTIATKMAVSESTVSRWLNASTVPSSKLKRVALDDAYSLIEELLIARMSGKDLADILNGKSPH